MALERLAPLDGTATADLKALGGAFLGLHLRHDCFLYVYMLTGAGDILPDLTTRIHLFYLLRVPAAHRRRGFYPAWRI
ncbi:hypothetical protein GCM10009097_50090 [Pigmentiphaga daeguensis]|uniref:Uncharacterized protein n=1 Tax=Pigmentiphaga daeguensis TaxID=414049 RepID=A0ABP3MW01_9BURK